MASCTSDTGAASLVNVASAAGQYGSSRRSVNAVSRPLVTDIVDVTLEQDISPAGAQVGQTVRCTVTLTNDSSVPIRRVRITLPDLAQTLNIRSVTYNGQTIRSGCLCRGISIPAIAAGGQAVVTVDAVVPQGLSGAVTSTAQADYTVSSADGFARLTVASGAAVLTVAAPGLEVEKTADRSFVTPENNVVTFTLTVRNTGAADVGGVVVTDGLPEGLTYVAGSTRVGGRRYTDQDPADGIGLGTLRAGESMAVSFRARASI